MYMREYIDIVETLNNDKHLVTLWHGGRNLELSYRDIIGNNSGSMEHGPGLYLTNFYSTAYKYAKGGGKTYLVSFIPGTNIDNVTLNVNDVLDFLNSNRFKNKKEIIPHIKKSYIDKIKANNVLNLMVNYNCLAPSNSVVFRKYLVDNGIDYLVSYGYGGFPDQTIVVIFNPKIIKSVNAIKASNVTEDMYKLPSNIN